MFDRNLEKYCAGYTSKPGMESPLPKKGDPQRSALIQFLIDKFGFTNEKKDDEDSIIVDFGSGNGVLAHEIDRLFPDNTKLPYYIAVDLPDALSELALPPRIHNNSKKLSVDEFYSEFLPRSGASIAAIVIRNVLHEMDIVETANLFCTLNKHISTTTDLYIQDMATLPEHERGKAGWMPELLCEFMSAIGIKSTMAKQESYGGTEWYILKAILPGVVTNIRQIQKYCADCRRKQHENILQQIYDLNQKTDEESATRLIQLQGDCTSISIQVKHCQISSGTAEQQVSPASKLDNIGIFISTDEMGEHDFCIKMQDDVVKQFGLVAILSNKSIIDFPAQYRSCKKELLLSGYSLRPLFLHENNRLAIESLLKNGIPVKILLVDPESEAAATRAKMPSYSSHDELFEQIRWTIQQTKNLNKKLLSDDDPVNLELRLTHRPPPCSYFFADNLCFLSLYSNRVTGSRGQCFIYTSKDGAFGSYYHFLIEDFKGEWERAMRITND